MRIMASNLVKHFYQNMLPFICSMLLIAPIIAAAEEKTGPVKPLPGPPIGASELANITLGLIVVLGLIFALAWLFRRYGNMTSLNRSNIQILGGVSLGSRERAVLLEVEGEKILIGVTPNQVTRLHVLKDEQTADIIADEQFMQADNVEDFASKLQQEKERPAEAKA